MVAIERVAAAGVIEITAVGAEHVIKLVVQSAERIGPAAIVAFAGVVEDDVEDHFDPGRVKRLDHVPELADLAMFGDGCGKSGFGCGERDGVVAPKILQPLTRKRVREGAVALVELVDGQQLDGRDAERFQVGDFLNEAGKGPRLAHPARLMASKAADVKFVDDRIFERDQRRAVVGPVVPGPRTYNLRRTDCFAFDLALAAPSPAAGDQRGRGVEKHDRRIVAGVGADRPVDPPTVAKLRPADREQRRANDCLSDCLAGPTRTPRMACCRPPGSGPTRHEYHAG